ncbi:hypothetical protein GCM10011573_29510 [Enterococcus wangshanyuanii]|uniref:Uncharacterized protein n=2 Tax=Enterococcus wangshanyuanii TaxID=2005703 RepID=A0ABQ1PJA1_9ENTE|nr:hypothetical protein GCM10011573_29510 [Enterococcus wangshanyuanii]
MIVKNNGNYIRHIGGVMLIPGVNNLDESDSKRFEEDMSLALNKKLVDSKEIEFTSSGSGKSVDSITDMKVPEASELIQDTFSLELLEQWIQDENNSKKPRTSIINQLENRIEEIKNPPADDIVDPEN